MPDSRSNSSVFFVPPADKISIYAVANSFPSYLYLWNKESASRFPNAYA